MRMNRPSLILKTISAFQMRMNRPSLILKTISAFQMRMNRPSLILKTISALQMVAMQAQTRFIDKHDPMGLGLCPSSEAQQTRLVSWLLLFRVRCRSALPQAVGGASGAKRR